MRLHINPKDGAPIYRQIIEQVRYLIASGRLAPGESMPPIRALAQELVVNPNTVARAYRELEQMGLLASRQGSGTVVADAGSPLARRERKRILKESIDGVLAEAHQLGFDIEEVVRLLRERNASFNEGDKEQVSNE